ncbi:MAG: NUDIX hydrolase [Candidatus Saccharimonadales bacterium]
MRKLIQLIGSVAFWVSWPVFRIYLRGSKRTRTLIICKGEFLVVSGWLGTGWSLPGGGLHRGEDPVTGALRELREETGIVLKDSQLIHLLDGHSSTYGLPYDYVAFHCVINEKPVIQKQTLEISAYEWRSLNNFDKLEPNTDHVLRQWIAGHQSDRME